MFKKYLKIIFTLIKKMIRIILIPFFLSIKIITQFWRKFIKLSFIKKVVVFFLFQITIFISIVLFTLLINFLIVFNSKKHIYKTQTNLPEKQTALILGAKVHSDGRLSDILRDRAQTALELYNNKKVQKILISGDHGRENYDEVNAIKDFLLEKKVNPKDIFLDHAGFDTYDSLYRARDIFKVNSLIIVTQEFHLARSIYIAKSLNIDAVGMKADKQNYWGIQRSKAREILARVKAFFNVALHSKPKFLGNEIPITGDSFDSWDKR